MMTSASEAPTWISNLQNVDNINISVKEKLSTPQFDALADFAHKHFYLKRKHFLEARLENLKENDDSYLRTWVDAQNMSACVINFNSRIAQKSLDDPNYSLYMDELTSWEAELGQQLTPAEASDLIESSPIISLILNPQFLYPPNTYNLKELISPELSLRPVEEIVNEIFENGLISKESGLYVGVTETIEYVLADQELSELTQFLSDPSLKKGDVIKTHGHLLMFKIQKVADLACNLSTNFSASADFWLGNNLVMSRIHTGTRTLPKGLVEWYESQLD